MLAMYFLGKHGGHFKYKVRESLGMLRPFIFEMNTVYPMLLAMYFLNKYDDHFVYIVGTSLAALRPFKK